MLRQQCEATMSQTKMRQILGAMLKNDIPLFDDRDVLYTRPEAAEYLRKSVPTLERWARLGIGPKPRKVGPRDVRYTLRSLREAAGTEGCA
jgi:hypothetical protein